MSKHTIRRTRARYTPAEALLHAAAIAAQAAEDAQAESGRSTPTKTTKRLQKLADACVEISKLRRKQKGKR